MKTVKRGSSAPSYLLGALALLLAGLAYIGGQGAFALLMLVTGTGCILIAPFMARFEDRDIVGELKKGHPVYITEDRRGQPD